MSNRRKVTKYSNGCKKNKKGLALKRWFKEDWRDVKRVKNVVVKKVRRGVRRIVAQVKVSSKTPKTTKEMTSTENVVITQRIG